MSLRVLEVEKEGRQIRISLPYKTVVRFDLYKQYYREAFQYPIEDKELAELMIEETVTEDRKFLAWEKEHPDLREEIERRLAGATGRKRRNKNAHHEAE